LFSEIVSVELAAIDRSETMRFNKIALAENLEIEDEKLRKAREEQLRKVFHQAQAEHQQLLDRVEALNAELSVVEKKIEHLEMRIKEARDFRN
jgi:predicted  nucleic acid-binding Zn-ribbon protein